MRTNFLTRGMKYSLMAVMMLITMVTAKAQPGNGGGGWQDSTDYPQFRVMQFMMDVNEEFEMDYGFMQWQLAGQDSSLIEPEVTFELEYQSPFTNQQFMQPTGMTISDEGVVNWTPTVAGNYYFGVRASLSDIPEETILIGNVIRVTPGQVQRCAKIVGQVTMSIPTDSMGLFRGAQVIALPMQGEQGAMTPYYGDMRANGTYRINVPAGSYKVAVHFMNTVKFYPNANNVDDAEVLTVACPDSVVANFTISNEDIPDIVYFTTYPQGYELNAGETGTYDADAVSTQGNAVNYRFEPIYDNQGNASAIATVDAETGVATFSATTRGKHSFIIEAYVPGDSLASEIQIVNFWVRGNQTPDDSLLCAYIMGTVTVDDLTDSVRIRGAVYALPMMDYEENEIPMPLLRQYMAEIGENGNYAIRVPAGDYRLVVKYGNIQKFYPNTLSIVEAQVLTLACNDSLVANFTISNEDIPEEINFTTEPQGYELNAGEVGTYDADAVSSQGNTINYRIAEMRNDNDEDVTVAIDAETGVATFSATTRGRHIFFIEAYVPGDSLTRAIQSVYFWVRNNQEPNDSLMCAYIRGTVTVNSEDEDFEIDGMVYALPVFNDNEPNTPGMRSYMAEIEEDGSYRVRVPAGDYKLLFYSEMCEPKFYENSDDYETATVITAVCGDTSMSYNITLEPFTPPVTYTVSGRVFSEANDEGLRAVVYLFLNNDYENETDFADNNYESGINIFTDDNNNEGNRNRRMIAVETNQDGTYSIEIPEGLSFKAFAKPRNQRMFIGEYYNNTTNIEDAELITLTENRSGVDFGLARFVEEPESQFNISGTVKDESNANVLAMVTLIRKPGDNENTNSYKFVNMATDTLGNYNFTNVKQGTYILFAMPVNRPLMPGFFVMGAPATWNWENATEIVVPAANGVMPTVQYDITLRSITDAPGAGRVAGRIERSMGGVINFAKGGSTSGVNGVLVTVYDESNRPVKYAHTDDNGNFDFDKLGFGEFTLKASKIGFGSKTTTVAIDAQNLTQSASLFMDEKAGTSDVKDMNNQFTVFPNPVHTIANFEFNAQTEGNAVLTISDMSGRDVITNYKTVVNGLNSIQIDAQDLSTGLYLVKIRLNNSEFQTLMNVIK